MKDCLSQSECQHKEHTFASNVKHNVFSKVHRGFLRVQAWDWSRNNLCQILHHAVHLFLFSSVQFQRSSCFRKVSYTIFFIMYYKQYLKLRNLCKFFVQFLMEQSCQHACKNARVDVNKNVNMSNRSSTDSPSSSFNVRDPKLEAIGTQESQMWVSSCPLLNLLQAWRSSPKCIMEVNIFGGARGIKFLAKPKKLLENTKLVE